MTKEFDRAVFESTLTKRFFYVPSFSIYGGVAGLYDYGPIGSVLQQNLINIWRKHFVIEEDMLEMDGAIITPSEVLKTSGHVEKFTDYMCRDVKTNEVFRADHLVEGILEMRIEESKLAKQAASGEGAGAEKAKKGGKGKVPKGAVVLSEEVEKKYEEILAQIDNFNGDQLGEIIKEYEIRNPATNNEVTEPVAFNLMFDSSIGPTGNLKGYLRPETAQAQFVNFQRLYEFNNKKMPFASAMVGKSFRNEISPRAGLLRVREFTMAEIEHYVDPLKKDHPKYEEVKEIHLNFLPAEVQESGSSTTVSMSIGEAVEKKIVNNQTLGYFLGRIYLFLAKIGIDETRLRFRQHMSNEMAHYATDCWDAEIKSSYGWVECVGCADRSAYDLTAHSRRTGVNLCAQEELEIPIVYDALVCVFNKRLFGPKFKQNAKKIQEALEALPQEQLAEIKKELDSAGKCSASLGLPEPVEITSDLLTIEMQNFKKSVREYTPNVIEPSFGIGRILYSLLEHSYYTRPDDASRTVFAFNPQISPIKCLVLPLLTGPAFSASLNHITKTLRSAGVAARIDDASSASIGRRYARNDELGIPFAITIDQLTVSENLVTLRERDSCQQIRANVDTIINIVIDIVNGKSSWEDVLKSHPTLSSDS
ncbi:putative glycine-tRNA ligase [Zancudomyces culisetae]|uniref:glycine--tRNA ligase n=1 Tax=Zancudomyces culisetae TaxID=1213189 RepID=A0A1R1PGM2_ZANCU|nr:putative glycine-tRNA ligase [Zancudomyces culisetae]|eukprot:OMH80002.1 putative glycine-tRNA ligase [Zancudomyces culisetae]